MVSSDFHIRRGSLLSNTNTAYRVFEDNGPDMDVISNVGATVSERNESISFIAKSIGIITKIKIPETDKPPELSKVVGLEIECEYYYRVGDEVNFKVYAKYDTGYRRDVSHLAKISQFSRDKPGVQIVDFEYSENNIIVKEKAEIYFST